MIENIFDFVRESRGLYDTILRKVTLSWITDSGIKPESVVCLGISAQRGSFTTWNMKDGRHYHKSVQCYPKRRPSPDANNKCRVYFSFITWKDLRADTMVREWNSSITMKGLRIGSQILYTLSRRKRFLAASVFKFMNTQVRCFFSFFYVSPRSYIPEAPRLPNTLIFIYKIN